MASKSRPTLSPLETRVMQIVWDRQAVTAEQVREVLAAEQPLKDSTVRTVLRRLEAKGYVRYAVEGRTYVYSPAVPPTEVAAGVLQTLIDRFFGGSVESLLTGMVNDRMLSAETLRRLAQKVAEAESRERGKQRPKP